MIKRYSLQGPSSKCFMQIQNILPYDDFENNYSYFISINYKGITYRIYEKVLLFGFSLTFLSQLFSLTKF